MAVVCAAAVLAGALIAASLVGSHDTADGTTTTSAATEAPQSSVLAGIRQSGTVLGRADAPVTVYEFADIQCPYCANVSRDVLPSVVREYVRTGRIRLDFRPLEFLGQTRPRRPRSARSQ